MKKKNALKGLGKRYDSEPIGKIDVGVLELIPYEYAGKKIIVDLSTDEFTAVCPYSGLPDFGTIRIQYLPAKHLIELRSLKYYLYSFRNIGIYQEHAVNRILGDLVKCCKPKWMQIELIYNVRGGLETAVTAKWGRG